MWAGVTSLSGHRQQPIILYLSMLYTVPLDSVPPFLLSYTSLYIILYLYIYYTRPLYILHYNHIYQVLFFCSIHISVFKITGKTNIIVSILFWDFYHLMTTK